MKNRSRLWIIRPLFLFWVIFTLGGILMGASAWKRLAESIRKWPELERSVYKEVQSMNRTTWAIGLMGISAGLVAFYLYRIEFHQEKIQRKLLDEKMKAEEAVKIKSAFLANMSHEIRSPMNAILGFSELLEPDGLTPKQSQYVRVIRDSGAALLQLINDILDLSKIEAGKLGLHPSPTDMRDSCEFLRTVFAQQAVKKSLQFQFDISSNLPRALLLDRLRLRQLLVNLLGNALKFTESGHIKTRVSWQSGSDDMSGTLLIEIEDTGIGIPDEKLKVIFEPFVQADLREHVQNQGTGIGLSIVRRLADLMGGVLTVDSKVNHGSIFRLRLPNTPVSNRVPVGDHAEPGGALDFNDLALSRILVVDDNQTNRCLIEGMFEKTHHRLHYATNGREALDFLDHEEVDVVLMDIRMPVMDGRTAFAKIRHRPTLMSLPVIAVTASSLDGDDSELISEFSGYIRKPFSRQTLFLALSKFIQHVPPSVTSIGQDGGGYDSLLPVPLPEHETEWRSLFVELSDLQAADWPALSASMAINETKAFAQQVFVLGHQAHCDRVTDYAAMLSTFADAYAIGDVERHLAQFPALVESVNQSLERLGS